MCFPKTAAGSQGDFKDDSHPAWFIGQGSTDFGDLLFRHGWLFLGGFFGKTNSFHRVELHQPSADSMSHDSIQQPHLINRRVSRSRLARPFLVGGSPLDVVRHGVSGDISRATNSFLQQVDFNPHPTVQGAAASRRASSNLGMAHLIALPPTP